MTIADSRVVARWKVNLSDDYEFLSMEIADDGAWVTYDDHKENLSLLAEAERVRDQALEMATRKAGQQWDYLTEKKRADALQSRLDAVAGLADQWVSKRKNFTTIGHARREERMKLANELRAALGCATTGEEK